jgi:tetratricopeptide (TPR) repeat protein
MDGFEQILRVNPSNMVVLQQLASMYIGFHQFEKAVKLFENVIEQDKLGPIAEIAPDQDSDLDEDDDPLFIPAPDSIMRFRMRFEDILFLADLYLKSGRFQEAFDTIEECGLRIVDSSAQGNETTLFRHPDVPIEIKLKLFACCVHLELDYVVEVCFLHSSRWLTAISALYQDHLAS